MFFQTLRIYLGNYCYDSRKNPYLCREKHLEDTDMKVINHFAEHLETLFKSLYLKFVSDESSLSYSKYIFAILRVQSFPITRNEGILFVGRATNQWHTTEQASAF